MSEILSESIVCVRPELDLESLSESFAERGVRAAPVVDTHGRALGIVTSTDLLRFTRGEPSHDEQRASPDLPAELAGERGFHVREVRSGKVIDVMTPVAFTLPEGASIARAAALMVFEGIHQLPIVGTDNRIVGMITSLDILRWFARKAGYVIAQS